MMTRFLFLLIFCLIGSVVAVAQTEDYKREINMEWEPIENAKSYDIEIQRIPNPENQSPLIDSSETAAWNGQLKPGKYTLRVRARDKRNAPGKWSSAEEFLVQLDPISITSPKMRADVMSNEESEGVVTLEWSSVPGAIGYKVEITTADGNTTFKEDVKESKLQIKLPVAKKYNWTVMPVGNEGPVDESKATSDFALWGKTLEKPQIEEPETAWVRTLKWNRPNHTDRYDTIVSLWVPATKTWRVIERGSNLTDNQMPFKQEWVGGRYKLAIRGKGELRPHSEKTEIVFGVVDGNRSPAAENIANLRQSIDRTNGLYGIASWLYSNISYRGRDADSGAELLMEPAGGTGRVGLGYLSPDYPWGFLAVADYSGFIIDNRIYNFSTVEGNLVHRRNSSDLAESRHYFGLFYKELPALYAVSASSANVSAIKSWGPKYQYEYWYAFTSRLGLQLNAQSYLSLFKISTPNGAGISPSLSFQLGMLGSYRLNKKSTGLLGVAYRQDSLAYSSNSGADKNTVDINGLYLNMFLEWSL